MGREGVQSERDVRMHVRGSYDHSRSVTISNLLILCFDCGSGEHVVRALRDSKVAHVLVNNA